MKRFHVARLHYAVRSVVSSKCNALVDIGSLRLKSESVWIFLNCYTRTCKLLVIVSRDYEFSNQIQSSNNQWQVEEEGCRDERTPQKI